MGTEELKKRLQQLKGDMPLILLTGGDCYEVLSVSVTEGWDGHEKKDMLLFIGGRSA